MFKTHTYTTVADAFKDATQNLPENECLRIPKSMNRDYYPDGFSMSYGEVWLTAEKLAARYTEAGYGPGHRIAILAGNHPALFIHWLALNSIGVGVVPVNPEYKSTEILAMLTASKAVLVLTTSSKFDSVRTVASQFSPPIPVELVYKFDSEFPSVIRPSNGVITRETEAGLLFTSGTSGLPKGCILDNEAFLFNGERYANAGGVMKMTYGEERLYSPLPMYYANSFSITNPAMILIGGCMIFPDRFHPKSFWQEIKETDPTIIHHIGMIPLVLLKQDVVVEEREHRIRYSGGAGVDPIHHSELEKRFGFPFVEFFGMSELGVCAADNIPPRKPETTSVGRPLAETEFKLVNSEDVEVNSGELGELCVRRTGPDHRRGLCREYLDNPEVTAQVWKNGWFHTGDILKRDEEGRFYFIDRIKHMIRRSGQNMSAAEIEAVLQGHPAINEVAVVPVWDQVRQEEPLACVVLNDGYQGDSEIAESIFYYSIEHLAYFKAPGWILFMDSLPRTGSEKLQKSALVTSDQDPALIPGVIDMRSKKTRQ